MWYVFRSDANSHAIENERDLKHCCQMLIGKGFTGGKIFGGPGGDRTFIVVKGEKYKYCPPDNSGTLEIYNDPR